MGERGPLTVNDYQLSSSREQSERLDMLFLDSFSLLPAKRNWPRRSETCQAKPDWPATADWLQNLLLPKAALRPLMFFSALRPGMFFAGIATADAFRRLASNVLFFLAPASLTFQHAPAVFSEHGEPLTDNGAS